MLLEGCKTNVFLLFWNRQAPPPPRTLALAHATLYFQALPAQWHNPELALPQLQAGSWPRTASAGSQPGGHAQCGRVVAL